MAWDFETAPELQELLDWADDFVRSEVEPLDLVLKDPYDKRDEKARALVKPLQDQVRERGLWACHLEPELGGQGYGQVTLALLNEVLGRSRWAPTVFGCQAPDSGNAEILAKFGTEEQKRLYLDPLLAGDVSSCYSMTEPQAGADPLLFRCTAARDGDGWVIDGEKWFSSNASTAAFFIVMAVTNPEDRGHRRMSMFVLPSDTPGIEIVRDVGLGDEPPEWGTHGYVRYRDVRVSARQMLGGEGDAFAIAQARLGGGRIHHAMRTVALARRAFEMLCERAVSRETRHGTLASLQLTQEKVADSWIQLETFRLLVLRTAWLIDKRGDYARVRKDIAAVKAMLPEVLSDIARRALRLHGALGVSNEMPFVRMLVNAESLGIADGPTEVHKLVLARELLKSCTPVDTLFPSGHLPTRRAAAIVQLDERLEREAAEL